GRRLPQPPRRAADPPGGVARREAVGDRGGPGPQAVPPRAAPLVRHPHAGAGGRHPGGPGDARPRLDQHDAGLHPGLDRAAAGRLPGRPPPGAPVVRGPGPPPPTTPRARSAADRRIRHRSGTLRLMTDQTLLSTLRGQLEDERARLEAQIAALEVGSDGTYDDNFADSGQVTAEQSENLALLNQLNDQLDEVNHALSKMDDGTYGICEVCGRPIAEARLEAMPATRFCIDHA